jgi:hypothetical protein
MKPTNPTIANIFAPMIRSGFVLFDVAGVTGHTKVIASGSWSDLPQVAQSHAAGSTSQPHSAQYIGGGLEGWVGDNAIGMTRHDGITLPLSLRRP